MSGIAPEHKQQAERYQQERPVSDQSKGHEAYRFSSKMANGVHLGGGDSIRVLRLSRRFLEPPH
jgi:hypothetical protein